MTTILSQTRERAVPSVFLKRVEVNSLFGNREVSINLYNKDGNASLAFIYGDNGSGKSTILRLIYSILSHQGGDKSKAYVARTPFSIMRIEFSDNSTCVVEKKDLIGGFDVTYSIEGKETRFSVATDSDFNVGKDSDDARRLNRFNERRGIRIIYIQDDRSLLTNVESISDAFSKNREWRHALVQFSILDTRTKPLENFDVKEMDRSNIDVISTLLHSWIIDQTISGGKDGQINVNKLYFDIAEVVSGATTAEKYTYTKKKLSEKIQDIQSKSELIFKHNLSPAVDFRRLLALVAQCQSQRVRSLGQAMNPYLDSLTALYDQISGVANVIDVFVTEISQYFDNVKIHFDLSDGFIATSWNDNIIGVSRLSSGQRQLFFMFACAALARKDNAILLIDEPEISLNIKWQRRLVPSLKRVLSNSPIQFICATHSFEILAPRKNFVSTLGGDDAS